MLSLEPPFWEIDGISVFRDHAVATQFYYGAPNPAVAVVAGRPMFDIFAYLVDLKQSPISGTTIPDQMGAGFLTMGVACAVSPAQLGDIGSKVGAATGLDPDQISLFPIPYHRGSVQVIALDKMSVPAGATTNPDGTVTPPPPDPAQPTSGAPTFVEAIMGSATPNLMGDLRSIFSLSLSQSGVTFLEGLYEDGAAPVGIVYDLAYYGLRPAVQCRITADVSTIYERFGGTAGVQYQYVRASIDAALDKMRQEGVVKVELTSEATGDEAQKSKDLAMSIFRDQIVQQLFRPTTPLSPTAAQVLGQALGQAASKSLVSLTLQYKKTEELKTVTYDYDERSPEERRLAPQAFLPLLVDKQTLESSIHRVNLHDPFFETLDVLVTGPTQDDFSLLGIRQAEATVTYGMPGDPVAPVTGTLLFRTDSTGDKHFATARQDRPSLDYSLAVAYDLDRTGDVTGDAFRYELPAKRETSRVVLLNPNADFGFLDVEVELGRLPDGIAEAEAVLSYTTPTSGFSTSKSLRLAPWPADPGASPPAANPHWRVRTQEPGLAPYSVACTWHFADGASYAQPPYVSREPLLVLDTPFAHSRTLLVRPNVTSEAISQVTVEIEYADPAHDYERSFLLTLAPPYATQTLVWPIVDEAVQGMRYRVTTTEPGFVSEGEWQTTKEPSIVVGSAGSRVGTIEVHLVGPTLAELGIDAVRLDLEVTPQTGAEGEKASLLMDDASHVATASLTYPPGAALAYRYQSTCFKSDGTTPTSDWTSQTSQLLVISTRNL